MLSQNKCNKKIIQVNTTLVPNKNYTTKSVHEIALNPTIYDIAMD